MRKPIQLDEELFLKKDANKLYVFSDNPTSKGKFLETSALSKEFRKIGFDFDRNAGVWVGDVSKLDQINNIIKTNNKKREIITDLQQIEDFIASSDSNPSKKNAVLDKLDQYIEDLANATDLAAMDAAIRNYLTFYGRFKKYSLANSWLIYLQKPDATKVAGYNTWKKLNRGVKKGATQIYIWFPMIKKQEDVTDDDLKDQGKQSSTMRFGLGTVYDIADTYAFDETGNLPDEPKWHGDNQPHEKVPELMQATMDFAKAHGINVTKADSSRGEKGYSRGGHINLSSDVEGVGEVSTFVHEIAHELLHHRASSPLYVGDEVRTDPKAREIMELQAESVAYTVMKYFDLPVTHHPTYLALWKADKEKIKKNMDQIIKASRYIIDGIEAILEKEPANTEQPAAQSAEPENVQEFKTRMYNLINEELELAITEMLHEEIKKVLG